MIDISDQNNLNESITDSNANKYKVRPCRNGCGAGIYLYKVSSNPDKWLPYESKTGTFHKCIKRPSKYSCKYCNEPITFNESKRSLSGKIIPLNIQNLSAHNCAKNPFNQSDSSRHHSG
jgi:hypothetical protein